MFGDIEVLGVAAGVPLASFELPHPSEGPSDQARHQGHDDEYDRYHPEFTKLIRSKEECNFGKEESRGEE